MRLVPIKSGNEMVREYEARLYVDGVWVTTQSACTPTSNTQEWTIAEGSRIVRLDYINCGAPASCVLEWSGIGMVRQAVPASAWR